MQGFGSISLIDYLSKFPDAIHLIFVKIEFLPSPFVEAKELARQKVIKYFSQSILNGKDLIDQDMFELKLQAAMMIAPHEFAVCTRSQLASKYIQIAFEQNKQRLLSSLITLADGVSTIQFSKVCKVNFSFLVIQKPEQKK